MSKVWPFRNALSHAMTARHGLRHRHGYTVSGDRMASGQGGIMGT